MCPRASQGGHHAGTGRECPGHAFTGDRLDESGGVPDREQPTILHRDAVTMQRGHAGHARFGSDQVLEARGCEDVPDELPWSGSASDRIRTQRGGDGQPSVLERRGLKGIRSVF